MKYIDLPKPHGYLIWRGKQKALVSPVKLPTDEKMLIIQEGQEAFGEVVLSTPSQISLTEFERLEDEHSIRQEERKLSWPDQKAFFFYRFKEFHPYLDSKDVEIEDGQAQVLPEVILSEDEKQLLERAERLPKTLILKDEAVVLEDGKAIFCEGLDGSQIMPILSTYFDNKEFNESLPLYQLALVRMPKLKLKKNMEDNMELEAEKADGTKPYKIVENHSGCSEEGKPVGVVNKETGKLMGCSEDMAMAKEHMAALCAAEEDKGGVGSGRYPEGSHTASSPGKKPPKKASTRKSKKELAQALVEALVDDDELTEEGEKDQSLTSKVQEVSQAFRDQFNPKPPDMPKNMPMYHWVKEVYPDYAIVGCNMGNGNRLYKVGYSIDENGQLKFADKSKWAELEVQLVPTGNVGAKSIMDGYEEAKKEYMEKSFHEIVQDYYDLVDKGVIQL